MNDTDEARFEQPLAEGAPTTQSDMRAPLPTAAPAESAAENQAGTPSRRTVPYGALAEERARRKELQRELQSAAETQQRLQERLELLHGLAQQTASPGTGDTSQPPQELVSDAALQQPQEANAAADGGAHAEAAFRTQLMHSIRDAMRERPDFLAAYQHARQARVSELLALGYTPDEALGITFENELEIIRNAYANGRNPAEIIYDYARRHGFGGGRPAGSSLGAGAAVRDRDGVMSEAAKVALAARGQAASKSLSTAGGGSTGTLTLEALAGMSDEEFAEATKGDRWQKLLKS